MHKIIVLRGNSGSGKTTVAKELQEGLGSNTMLVSQDAIRRDMLKVKAGEGTPAIPLLMELLMYGRNSCEVVILEGILVADWYRSLFELAVELYGTNIYAYYYDISFEETLRRHQTRSNRCEFSEEAMRSWWRNKDYSDILNEKIISENQSKEKTRRYYMKYKINERIKPEDISSLREAVGWNKMEKEFRNPLLTSYCHIAAYEGTELIGYIDSISNGVTDAYIQDLMVHPKYQGKGIGTELMNQMIAYMKEKHIYMVSVIFEEELKTFYERFGFYTMLSGQLETYESI